MEPETEFNPKQMQNPQDNGFEKMSYHGISDSSPSFMVFHHVCSFSFAQGSDHSQGLRLV
jgi:hypothetical protein